MRHLKIAYLYNAKYIYFFVREATCQKKVCILKIS